jgi:hypothetical protein
MAPTILHVGAIQDRQADYIRRAFRPLVSSITAPDLEQNVARLRHRGDHIPRESGSRQCASRPSADAQLPTPCAHLVDLGAIRVRSMRKTVDSTITMSPQHHARRHRSAR